LPDFQTDVLDHIARVVGGTVSAVDPHFFSGPLAAGGAGDGTGISGLTGCYSAAPAGIGSVPVGILLPSPFKAELMSQGEEENTDEVRLLILVASADTENNIAQLMPYRDSVPAAFRSHMRAFTMPNTGWAFVSAGDAGVHTWGGVDYFAWTFTIRVHRDMAVSYQDGPP
jgi:hypothetical protein